MNTNIYTTESKSYDFSTLPASLRTSVVPAFVLYKAFQSNGRLNKIPYQINGLPASCSDDSTWSTYEQSLRAYQSGGYTGIGLMLKQPLVAIDLDHVIDESGNLHPTAKKIIDMVPSGWMERSVSGTGVHIFGLCVHTFDHTRMSWTEGEKKYGIEIYQEKRFIALTGNRLEGSSEYLGEISSGVSDIYQHYIAPQYARKSGTKAIGGTGNGTSGIDIDARLELAYASKNGAAIRALMAGEVTAHGGDHSAADLALCQHLAFWLDNCPAAIEQAFDRSGLANRDKWQRSDYRSRTIQAAISNTTDVYRPMATTPAPVPQSKVGKVLAMVNTWKLSTLEVPPVEYVYPNFLIKGSVTAFTGESGHGKSTFVLNMVHQIAQDDQYRVIYADNDNPASIAKDRSNRLRGELDDKIMYWGGFSLDGDGVPCSPWPIADPSWLDLIRQVNAQGKHVVLVLDTWNSFFPDGSSENDNSVVGGLMVKLRDLTYAGATIVLIHHVGKSATSKEFRGASAFKASLDAGFLIESTFAQNEIKTMTVSSWKNRMGKTSTECYRMTEGRLYRDSDDDGEDTFINFISKHQGKNKGELEIAAAKEKGIARNKLRSLIDQHLEQGTITMKGKKIYNNPVTQLAIAC